MSNRELEEALRKWIDQYPWQAFAIGIPVFLLITFWSNWRLIKRIGYPGIGSFLFLIPGLWLFVMVGLAFSKWPNERP